MILLNQLLIFIPKIVLVLDLSRGFFSFSGEDLLENPVPERDGGGLEVCVAGSSLYFAL